MKEEFKHFLTGMVALVFLLIFILWATDQFFFTYKGCKEAHAFCQPLGSNNIHVWQVWHPNDLELALINLANSYRK